MTIHQSKGLEFDVVVIIDLQHKLMKSNPSHDNIEFHKNMAYVAVTRARDELYVLLQSNQLLHESLLRSISLDIVDVFIDWQCFAQLPETIRSRFTDSTSPIDTPLLKLQRFDDIYCLDITERKYKHGRARIGVASDIRTWCEQSDRISMSQQVLLHIEEGLNRGLIGIERQHAFCHPA